MSTSDETREGLVTLMDHLIVGSDGLMVTPEIVADAILTQFVVHPVADFTYNRTGGEN